VVLTARAGSFSGGTFSYGEPLSVVHPIDSKFPSFDPEILAEPGLTEEQRYDLQGQLDELAAALTLARGY
jgi:hypothetical protein